VIASPAEDFHKQIRAFLHDFASLNSRWAPSPIPVREFVRFCTILLVEIIAPGRGAAGVSGR
jgi:hypothetical protein